MWEKVKDRINKDCDAYRESILKLSKDEIYDSAYAISTVEDIRLCVNEIDDTGMSKFLHGYDEEYLTLENVVEALVNYKSDLLDDMVNLRLSDTDRYERFTDIYYLIIDIAETLISQSKDVERK